MDTYKLFRIPFKGQMSDKTRAKWEGSKKALCGTYDLLKILIRNLRRLCGVPHGSCRELLTFDEDNI